MDNRLNKTSQVPVEMQTMFVLPGKRGGRLRATATPLVSAEALGLHALRQYIKLIFSHTEESLHVRRKSLNLRVQWKDAVECVGITKDHIRCPRDTTEITRRSINSWLIMIITLLMESHSEVITSLPLHIML